MSVYCIQSEVGYLERMLPFIEEITTECMDFYEQFFGHKFAFSKYDQVFAHEYKWGAMENAGIVIINDRSIIK
jgi:aminopeptidase N